MRTIEEIKQDIEKVIKEVSSLGMFDSDFDDKMEDLNEKMEDLLDELDFVYLHKE